MCRGDVRAGPARLPTLCSGTKIMKPMLPRKITSSARINLNKYWNVLEELVTCSAPLYEFQDGGRDSDMSNEINENLANERLEMSSGVTCRHSDSNIEFKRSCDRLQIEMGMSRSQEVTIWDRCDPCMQSGLLRNKFPLSLVELSLRVIKLGG